MGDFVANLFVDRTSLEQPALDSRVWEILPTVSKDVAAFRFTSTTGVPVRKFIAGAVSAAILSTGLVLAVPVQSGAVSIVKYKNCAALNKKFPHGVGIPGARDKTSGKKVTNYYRSKALYLKNKSRDRDKDNIACEKR